MFDDGDENRAEVDQIGAVSAVIMGRNMFGPVRGPWDRQWNGWWGDDPPFHASVFVLTHHARPPQPMDGGTTYHFVTDGIHAALELARGAAGSGDVSIHGGAHTVNQYLAAGLVDDLHLHVVPMTLGSGARLFDGVPPLDLEQLSAGGQLGGPRDLPGTALTRSFCTPANGINSSRHAPLPGSQQSSAYSCDV